MPYIGDQWFDQTLSYLHGDNPKRIFRNPGSKPFTSYLKGRIPPLPSGREISFSDAEVQTFDPTTGESITGTELRRREKSRRSSSMSDRAPAYKRYFSELSYQDDFNRALRKRYRTGEYAVRPRHLTVSLPYNHFSRPPSKYRRYGRPFIQTQNSRRRRFKARRRRRFYRRRY